MYESYAFGLVQTDLFETYTIHTNNLNSICIFCAEIMALGAKALIFGYLLAGLIAGPMGRKYSIIVFGLLTACSWMLVANMRNFEWLQLAVIMLSGSLAAMRVPYHAYFGEYW